MIGGRFGLDSKQNAELAEKGRGENLSRGIEATGGSQKSAAHVTVCSKIAKNYNVVMMRLRHHLLMVAFSLGLPMEMRTCCKSWIWRLRDRRQL